MNPETDVNIVVAGEGAQTAAMLRSKQVDALSQFDTQYAMVENAGVKLRLLDTKEIDSYPSNGFLALEETSPHAEEMPSGSRAVMPRARSSPSPTRRLLSASCMRSFQSSSRPEKTKPQRSETTPRC